MADTPKPTGSTGKPLNRGFGRVLVFVYGVFALSASARAGVQIGTKFSEAPLAYSLSALAALVYIVATVALARSSATSRRVAWFAVGFELLGVLAVGTASLVDGKAFPDATVWSDYGQGYGYVPLVLPFIGLFWLWRTKRHEPVAETTAAKG
nr:membrane protein [Dactylosporangium thailandense]